MEQKERYEWNSRFDEAIKDNQTGDIVNAVEVLNQQDKENQQLKQQVNDWKQRFGSSEERNKQLTDNSVKALELKNEKIKKLKQQLHDLPKKIVEDIKIQMGSIEDILINCGNGKEDALCWFNECLDSILKKYGGE